MFTRRQVWGLAVRQERALRAIGPRIGGSSSGGSGSNSTSSDETVHQLFQSLGWLCPDLAAEAGVSWARQSTVASLRLLACLAASALKSAQGDSYFSLIAASNQVVNCWDYAFIHWPLPSHNGRQGETQQQIRRQADELAAAAPAMICFLLPRLAALLSEGTATRARDIDALGYLLRYSTQWSPERSLRLLASCHVMKLVRSALNALLAVTGDNVSGGGCVGTCNVIGTLGEFTCVVAHLAFQLVTQGCSGAPVGSPQLRDMLARPLLQLLGSPLLLDLLARLQHVPVCSRWATHLSSTSNHLPPWNVSPLGPQHLQEAPQTMQLDADNASFAMQVSG